MASCICTSGKVKRVIPFTLWFLQVYSNTVPKVHNEELAKQWLRTLLSMYYLLQTTCFNQFTYVRKLFFKSCILNMGKYNGVFLVTFASIRHPWGQLSNQVRLTALQNYMHVWFRFRLGPGLSNRILRGSSFSQCHLGLENGLFKTLAGNCLGQCCNVLDHLRAFHPPPTQVGHAGISYASWHSASAELLVVYCCFW